jgi:channel protein (hemolysin III family)
MNSATTLMTSHTPLNTLQASYGVGTIFFSSDGKLPFAHGMWHVFVLGGSLCVDVALAGALGLHQQ